jgi:hypothetical protein
MGRTSGTPNKITKEVRSRALIFILKYFPPSS